MENRSHALWAGFFTIAMLCATIVAGMWLNRDKTVRTAYQIATTRPVSGLNPQAAVRYKGLGVGRVDKIDFDPDLPGQILINISVDPDTPVTQSTFATLAYQGVTGLAFVQLDDDETKPTRIVAEEGKLPRIPLKPGLFERIEASGTKILANAEMVSDRLAKLLTPENQKTILGAFSGTSDATARWSKLAQDLQPTVEMLPDVARQSKETMISIQGLSTNAAQLSAELTSLTRQLQDTHGPLNRSLTDLSNLTEQVQTDTLPKINSLTMDAGKSMRGFDKTMEELKDHPQSLIFGKPTPTPGPGEPGFTDPKR